MFDVSLFMGGSSSVIIIHTMIVQEQSQMWGQCPLTGRTRANGNMILGSGAGRRGQGETGTGPTVSTFGHRLGNKVLFKCLTWTQMQRQIKHS